MIEAVSKNNLEEVLPLILDYQAFYQIADRSMDKNRTFFQQFGEHNPVGCQFVFRESGRVVGFATLYFSFSSSIAEKVAVLNDLYTVPEYRGKSIGRQLIEHCRRYAAQQGAVRLQWVTAPDNQTAQKLYDSLETKKSSWEFYTYSV